MKNKYTIVIVTHNMQQAGRVRYHCFFFYMGELIEYDKQSQYSPNRQKKKQTEDYITGRFKLILNCI
jgi:phosphate transport system ATP-binding protein